MKIWTTFLTNVENRNGRTKFSFTCNHYDTIINNDNFLTYITCGLEIDIYGNDSIIFTPITDFNTRKLEENTTFRKNSKIVSGKATII